MSKGLLKSDLFPKEISPKDDAYHGSNKFIASEWWYFDAIFNNNYSLHVDFTTFTKNYKITSSAIEIYKNGKLEVKAIKRHLFKDVKLSKNYPFIKINDKKIMEFDLERYNKKGEWIYNFSNKIDNHHVDLNFIGTTKGWKFETDAESWAVALPKAKVKGELSINGKKIEVEGIGYHDHNWNSTISTVLYIWGWYWGKVSSEKMNFVWSYIKKTSNEGKFRGIINHDDKGFIYIDPNKIHFKTNKYIRSHGRKIPTNFVIRINDTFNSIPIKIDININVEESHFKSLLIFPYWRHHIKATGFMSIGDYKEEVNSTHIMECFRLF